MARTQIRLGLVVEGGVSLAVWMSGVAHEVDLLRRAGDPEREPLEATAEMQALSHWRALCDDLDVDVVVDLVSGTSAGGINGALLACASATGQPLPPLRDLWVSAAQLQRDKLLRPAGTEPLPSLLDGRYFEEQLRSVFAKALGSADADPTPEPRRPVTLLTTATALGPQTTKWADSTGGHFRVADHRRVYRFRNDPDRQVYAPPAADPVPDDIFDLFSHADPHDLRATAEAVAAVTRAARATASFPAAFQPVKEQDGEADLRPYRVQGTGDGSVLIDGGVLVNTPIEPLLDEIGRRAVDGNWRRVIGYITANDGLAESTVSTGENGGRRIATEWFPVLTSAQRMGSEASFRHGVEALAQHALDAERLISGPEAFFEQVLSTGKPEPTAVESLYGLYRQNRVEGGVLDAYLLKTGRSGARPVAPAVMDGLDPDDAPGWVPPERLQTALNPDEWRWGTAVADRSLRILLRHLNAWSTSRSRPVDVADTLRELSRVLGAVTAVRDFITDRILSTAEDDEASTLLRAVNDAIDAASGPAVLAKLMRRATDVYAAARASVDQNVSARNVLDAVLVTEVVSQAVAGRVAFSRPARFDAVRMGPDITSPVLADPGGRQLGEWKLYGRQLGHFGAFGRPEWREHDFIWGRLDGAAHMVRVLARVAGSPLRDSGAADAAVASAQEAIMKEEHTDATRVTAALREVARLDTRTTLDGIRRTPDGQKQAEDVVTDLLRMLRIRATGTPGALSTAGDWASTLLAKKLPRGQPSGRGQRGVRMVAKLWPRPRFWKWVDGPRSPK